jgi:hypothetical protein
MLKFTQRSVPLALLVLCILAYGPLLARLGFYWDDWPWIWISHAFGPQGVLKIDQGYRPLAGVILWLGEMLAGNSPLLWQILNLVFRWLSGLALWWALRKIFPASWEKVVWIAFIFMVYPGFRQQFISINSSRHILPLAIYFFSLGFMVWALQERRRYWLLTATALLLQALSMLSTEYYYGLELIRPVILWIVLRPLEKSNLGSLKQTLKYWVPYLSLFMAIVVWRYIVSPQGNYPVVITDDFANQPWGVTVEAIGRIYQASLTTALLAWSKLFEFPTLPDIGLQRMFLYGALVLISLFLSLAYLLKLEKDKQEARIWITALGLGLLSIFVAGLPFLVTGIWVGLNFPSDRTTLPMAFGASLLLVGVIDWLARKRTIKIVLISLLVGLSVGVHYSTAIAYEKDWQVQSSLYRQLVIRIPGLKPGTALFYEYTTVLQDMHFTDNSLVAPLNWMYFPDYNGGKLPVSILDLREREKKALPALQDGRPVVQDYGKFDFSSLPGNALVLQFSTPGCLQVLLPENAGLYPHLPDSLSRAVQYSNVGVIVDNPDQPAQMPEAILEESVPDWCYYFEKADLARQLGDWQKVVELGNQAFALQDYPKAPTERLPFIQGYGYSGMWARAEELTWETLDLDLETKPLLCSAWMDLIENTPDSVDKNGAVSRLMARLECQVQ